MDVSLLILFINFGHQNASFRDSLLCESIQNARTLAIDESVIKQIFSSGEVALTVSQASDDWDRVGPNPIVK
jgi:hypothetical protein